MATLICIDNGGTLTDAIAVRDGAFYRAKALTTPHDLSRCFIDAIAALSSEIYGEEALDRLLAETELIRYSTTQGTNALVQARDKGPRLGLILPIGTAVEQLQTTAAEQQLFATLVNDRVAELVEAPDEVSYGQAIILAINRLMAAGCNRVVLALDGPNYGERELRFRRAFLKRYPRHFLGAVPVLLAHELAQDDSLARRAWSALLNSFLHPTMETFLYNAENELRRRHMTRPLMVFRNDGNSSRVARTVALKTYSSGPRGGMEGAKAYAQAYQASRIVSFDVGGTTTDIGVVVPGEIDEIEHGRIEGVETSFPLCDILSAGVGGSSVLGWRDGACKVGPESVGAAPGPACFDRGGDLATITDVYLLMGYFDPATYFGGKLRIDPVQAAQAIEHHVAQPSGLAPEQALLALDDAYHQVMARAITGHAAMDADTVLMAFGGAGPMSACKVAELAQVGSVIVPHAAAVFCAYGIGFSNVHYRYEEAVGDEPRQVQARLLERARRDMYSEGFAADDCEVTSHLVWQQDGQEQTRALGPDEQLEVVPPAARVRVTILRRLTPFPLRPIAVESISRPVATATRVCLQPDGSRVAVPLYHWDQLAIGANAAGPAILENAYTTVRVLAGWRFAITGNRDILLTRSMGELQ